MSSVNWGFLILLDRVLGTSSCAKKKTRFGVLNEDSCLRRLVRTSDSVILAPDAGTITATTI